MNNSFIHIEVITNALDELVYFRRSATKSHNIDVFKSTLEVLQDAPLLNNRALVYFHTAKLLLIEVLEQRRTPQNFYFTYFACNTLLENALSELLNE